MRRYSQLLPVVVGLGLAFCSATVAQAQTVEPGAPQPAAVSSAQPPLCDPDAIDGTFTFANQPAGEQTVSLHLSNAGVAACRLQGRIAGSFSVDGHSMHVSDCWLCDANDKPLPYQDSQPGNQILLAPGGQATLDLHWETTGASCQWADWVDFFAHWTKNTGYVVVPSSWPMHICSPVRSSGYRAGAESPFTGAIAEGGLRVSLTQSPVYDDETATLHIQLMGREADLAGCASVYRVSAGAARATQLDSMLVLGSHPVASFTPMQLEEDSDRAWPNWKKDRLRACDIPAGQTAADAQVRADELARVTHIEWNGGLATGDKPVFFSTPTHFTVLDVDTLNPNWGETADGIRAGLSIDRASFRAGERIPLHLRWENVSAAKPLGQGECQEPHPSIEIQDERHNVIKTLPTYPNCFGHGWGPFAIAKGKAQRTFRELTSDPPPSAGQFPRYQFNGPFIQPIAVMPKHPAPEPGALPGPGVYYLVAVWSPRLLEEVPNAEAPGTIPISPNRIGEVYATARSQPVRIEITSSGQP